VVVAVAPPGALVWPQELLGGGWGAARGGGGAGALVWPQELLGGGWGRPGALVWPQELLGGGRGAVGAPGRHFWPGKYRCQSGLTRAGTRTPSCLRASRTVSRVSHGWR
jgi:hypothetical protein